jgi:hypothetical protein
VLQQPHFELGEVNRGRKKMAEIQEKFGDEALDLIGRLYQEDCLGFE